MNRAPERRSEAEAESLRGRQMKQLSSFFVVVGETPRFSVCETMHADGGDVEVWRFVIEWDEDHDLRVVDLVNHLIATGVLGSHRVTRVYETAGHLTIWSWMGPDAFCRYYDVNGDHWSVFVDDGKDTIGEAVEAGSRRWVDVVGGVE